MCQTFRQDTLQYKVLSISPSEATVESFDQGRGVVLHSRVPEERLHLLHIVMITTGTVIRGECCVKIYFAARQTYSHNCGTQDGLNVSPSCVKEQQSVNQRTSSKTKMGKLQNSLFTCDKLMPTTLPMVWMQDGIVYFQ